MVYLLLIGVILIGLLTTRYQFNQEEKWDLLVSQAYGYQIEYPANWKGEVIESGRGSDYLHGRMTVLLLPPCWGAVFQTA
jgi:hypothetical protein